MKQVIVTVETDAQARQIVRALARAEVNGRLDFSFGVQTVEVPSTIGGMVKAGQISPAIGGVL